MASIREDNKMKSDQSPCQSWYEHLGIEKTDNYKNYVQYFSAHSNKKISSKSDDFRNFSTTDQVNVQEAKPTKKSEAGLQWLCSKTSDFCLVHCDKCDYLYTHHSYKRHRETRHNKSYTCNCEGLMYLERKLNRNKFENETKNKKAQCNHEKVKTVIERQEKKTNHVNRKKNICKMQRVQNLNIVEPENDIKADPLGNMDGKSLPYSGGNKRKMINEESKEISDRNKNIDGSKKKNSHRSHDQVETEIGLQEKETNDGNRTITEIKIQISLQYVKIFEPENTTKTDRLGNIDGKFISSPGGKKRKINEDSKEIYKKQNKGIGTQQKQNNNFPNDNNVLLDQFQDGTKLKSFKCSKTKPLDQFKDGTQLKSFKSAKRKPFVKAKGELKTTLTTVTKEQPVNEIPTIKLEPKFVREVLKRVNAIFENRVKQPLWTFSRLNRWQPSVG